MMVSEAMHNIHIFIKERYLVDKDFNEDDVSSSSLYTAYKNWFKNNYHNKKPSSIQEFSYKMKEIELVAQQMRKNGTRKMRYQISRTSLYNTYMKKGWVDSLENIKEPANDNVNSVIQSTSEINSSEIGSSEEHSSQQNVQTTPLVVNISTETIPAPEPLKMEIKKSTHIQIQSDNIPSSSLNEVAEQSTSAIKQILFEKSVTQENSEIETTRCSETSSHVAKKYDDFIEDVYNNAKEYWVFFGLDADDFTWDCFLLELEELRSEQWGNSLEMGSFRWKIEGILYSRRERIHKNWSKSLHGAPDCHTLEFFAYTTLVLNLVRDYMKRKFSISNEFQKNKQSSESKVQDSSQDFIVTTSIPSEIERQDVQISPPEGYEIMDMSPEQDIPSVILFQREEHSSQQDVHIDESDSEDDWTECDKYFCT
jgi:hypothetical protein